MRGGKGVYDDCSRKKRKIRVARKVSNKKTAIKLTLFRFDDDESIYCVDIPYHLQVVCGTACRIIKYTIRETNMGQVVTDSSSTW